jgi:hypothetical protein
MMNAMASTTEFHNTYLARTARKVDRLLRYLDNLLSTTPVPFRVGRTGARDGEQYTKSDADKTSTR